MIKYLIRNVVLKHGLHKRMSPSFKTWIRKFVPVHKYKELVWRDDNPFIGTEYEHGYNFDSRHTIGILADRAHYFANNIQACIEERQSYTVIDYSRDDWIERVKASGCDYFLASPTVYSSVTKEMSDNRFRIMGEELGKFVFPTEKETWLYESKIRVREWLEARGYPHVKTWVFYDKQEALDFIEDCKFPLVLKTDTTGNASGVFILRTPREARKKILECFNSGITTRRGDPRDRYWGCAYLQEYIEDAREWRMVRVGESFFCRIKGKIGDFHSGSGVMSWGSPPPQLIDLFYRIAEDTGFKSVNLDFFETSDGRFLINEFHTVFGAILEKNVDENDPLMGRYLTEDGINWTFERGFFYRNACANLRVQVLKRLMEDREGVG